MNSMQSPYCRASLVGISAALLVLLSWAGPARAADIEGQWDIIVDMQGQEMPAEMTVTKEAGTYKGVISSMQGDMEVPEIKVEGDKISFDVEVDTGGQMMKLAFDGKLEDGKIIGTIVSDLGDMGLTATRKVTAVLEGQWDVIVDMQGQEMPGEMTVTQKADGSYEAVLSSMQGELEVPEMKLEGTTITFDIEVDAGGQMMTLAFEGTLEGDKITGTLVTDFGDMPMNATRHGAGAPAIAGTWDLTSESQAGTFERVLVINPDLTGKYKTDDDEFDVESLKVDGADVTFEVTISFQGQELALGFEGKLDGDSLKGEFFMDGMSIAEVSAKRQAEKTAPAIAGTWDLTSESQAGTFERVLVINDDLTGKYKTDDDAFDVVGLKVDGDKVTFEVTISFQGQELTLEFEGTLDGGSLTGEFFMDGSSIAEVTAKKQAAGNLSSLVGSWSLDADSALGPLAQKLTIKEDGSAHFESDGIESEVTQLRIEDGKLQYNVTIMSYEVEFVGMADGDKLTGDYMMGGMSVAPVEGKRS